MQGDHNVITIMDQHHNAVDSFVPLGLWSAASQSVLRQHVGCGCAAGSTALSQRFSVFSCQVATCSCVRYKMSALHVLQGLAVRKQTQYVV